MSHSLEVSKLHVPLRWTLTLPVLVMSLVVLGRLFTLEWIDLLDPSETRYAYIAAYMAKSGNWLTPQLMTPSGSTPFLSKPPLHYWLVALCYRFLGIDEWTSRLPSFMAFTTILGCCYLVTSRIAGRSAGMMAALLCSISPLLYFVSGGTTVDVTFSAFIALSLTFFFFCQELATNSDKFPSRLCGWSFFAATAAAFLVKGPLALVLIGLPIFGHCLSTKSCHSLTRLPLYSGSAVFLAVVLPWFLKLESSLPGSVRYFVWNENILRYLSKDYGDRYGDGHEHFHGTIILFFLLANLIPFLVTWGACRKASCRHVPSESFQHPFRWFLWLWALGPVLFFTLARNILPSYILPGSAGTAIILALFLVDRSTNDSAQLTRWISTRTAWISVAYVLITIGAGQFMSSAKSSEAILRQVVSQTSISKGEVRKIGVWGTDNLSPFWLSLAGELELGADLEVQFENDEGHTGGCVGTHLGDILVRAESNGRETFSGQHPDFQLRAKVGRWLWFHRNGTVQAAHERPTNILN
jgi:4-amino-4-deoxy-L-arabinose transferase-like glycosyltransferase